MLATAHRPTEPHYSTFMADHERRLTPGSLLLGGRLELVAEVARGGTSVVYRAIDHADGDRLVALKVVDAGATPAAADARFRNEIRLMKRLSGHPHVVPAVATGHLDGPSGFVGRSYLLTHFIQGEALDRVMGDHRRGLEWRRACSIARDVARALVDLHERGIVHRDIKPGNVLLARSPSERALLVDFGLAYATRDEWEPRSPDVPHEGTPGTLLYMSPQQVAHELPTPSMDVYAFGITLYELLSGNPPHHKLATGEILARKCDANRMPFAIAKLCPELDRRITGLVDRCLQYEPDTRPTARELLDMLDGVLGEPRGPATNDLRLAPRVEPRAQPILMEPQAQPILVELRPVLAEPVEATLVVDPEPDDRGPWAIAATAVALAVVVMGVMARFVASDDPGATREQLTMRAAAPAPSHAPKERAPVATPLADENEPRKPSESRPTGAVEAPATVPTLGKGKPMRRREKCPEAVAVATQAAADRQWDRVLQLTDGSACWKPRETEERVKLRVQALFETLRYDECAEIGEGASDPDIFRWAHICASKSRGESR